MSFTANHRADWSEFSKRETMSAHDPDEFDAYLKGYEDAMRAAGGNPPPAPLPTTPPSPAPAAAGAGAKRAAGFAAGWLLGFPLLFGIVGGVTGLLLGGPSWALAGFLLAAGVAFAYALFVGGGLLALRFWPVTLALGALVVSATRLFD
jgi:hypothetical protein